MRMAREGRELKTNLEDLKTLQRPSSDEGEWKGYLLTVDSDRTLCAIYLFLLQIPANTLHQLTYYSCSV